MYDHYSPGVQGRINAKSQQGLRVQSSSASRRTTGAAEFLNLSQSGNEEASILFWTGAALLRATPQ